MKKIIWIFGQSATGKKTLINKLLEYDRKTLDEIRLNSCKITACNNTINDNKDICPAIIDTFSYDDSKMQEDNEYFNRETAKNKRSCIMTDCSLFLSSDSEIFLIKGQDNHIWPGRGDTVKYFLKNFANIKEVEIEVYILSVQDDELWKKRIQSKEWFINFADKDSVMRNMTNDRLTKNHENAVKAAFHGYNIPITIIDSRENQYTII